MKTSSAPTPAKPIDSANAWGLLVANLLVLPGLGTYTAGQKITGILQAILALTGLVLTGLWFYDFAGVWWRTGVMPSLFASSFHTCLAGLALFLCGWTWALASSLLLIKRASDST